MSELSLREYQKEAVRAAMETLDGGSNALIVMPCGCLTGDTTIFLNRGGNTRKYTLEDAYRSWNHIKKNGYSKLFDHTIPTYTRSFIEKENRVGLNLVHNIVYSGIKETFLLTLEDGKQLKLTNNHKIMTSDGFVELRNLREDSLVMVDDNVRASAGKVKKKFKDKRIQATLHPFARINSKPRKGFKEFKAIEEHRAIYEAHINNINYEDYKKILINGSDDFDKLIFIDPKIYDIHHIDFNHQNNSVKNLIHLTKDEHRKIHGLINFKNFNQGKPSFSKIKSIEYNGLEKTYDISCEQPNNNFNAEGIIVHNSGKTEVFFSLIEEYLKKHPNENIVILLNRIMLWQQTVNRILKKFPEHLIGNVCGTRGARSYKQITVGTVQSIAKDARFDLCIVDEAHRTSAAYEHILSNCAQSCAFTATPFRADGYIYGEDKRWGEITYKKDLIWMIENDYLVKPVVKKSNEEFDLTGVKTKMGDWDQKDLDKKVSDYDKVGRQVTDALTKSEGRNRIVWCCVNIYHAELIYNFLKDKMEDTVIIHSARSDSENVMAEDLFRRGCARHLVFVTMVSEGIDVPEIDAVIMMRPTKSATLWVQTAGRGLRKAKNKTDCLILDYGRVVENCGPLNNPIVRGKGRGNILQEGEKVKFCPSCLCMIHSAAIECEFCGYEYPAKDPTKNLTDKASTRDVLGAVKQPEWIEINPVVKINSHITRKGDECLRVEYTPKSYFRHQIKEYIMSWQENNKLNKLGLGSHNVHNYVDTEYLTRIKRIQVDYSSGFASIIGVEYV